MRRPGKLWDWSVLRSACRPPQPREVNEGVNSMVKNIVKKAPHIGLPLLGSRIVMRKALNLGTRALTATQRQKWSLVKPRAAAVLRACSYACDGDGYSVLHGNPRRWVAPPSATAFPGPDAIKEFIGSVRPMPVENKWAGRRRGLLGKDVASLLL